MEITEKDIKLGETVRATIRCCPEDLNCFWSLQDNLGCEKEGLIITDKGEQVYRGKCLIYGLMREFQVHCPYLLFCWQRYALELSVSDDDKDILQRGKFLTFSFQVVVTLHSANGWELPWCSKEMIARLEADSETNFGEFLRSIYKELNDSNPRWFRKFYEETKEKRLGVPAWKFILILAKIFLEGMKPPEPFQEKIVTEIEQFLASKKKKNRT